MLPVSWVTQARPPAWAASEAYAMEEDIQEGCAAA
jgi:hypothetical protein